MSTDRRADPTPTPADPDRPDSRKTEAKPGVIVGLDGDEQDSPHRRSQDGEPDAESKPVAAPGSQGGHR